MFIPITQDANLHCAPFRGNHEFIYNTFSFQAVYIWNKISRCVSTNVSFPKFKKISKAYIQFHQLLMRLNI